MPDQPTHPVKNRGDWILRLLYAPGEYNNTNTPLYGRTRMMKACFLLSRNLKENFDIDTGFDFKPDKYGPFDQGVYEALEFLEDEQLLSISKPSNHPEPYDLLEYKLTDEGEEQARELFSQLSNEEQELIKWVKNKQAMKKLGSLLNYVYNEYPDMTRESELV